MTKKDKNFFSIYELIRKYMNKQAFTPEESKKLESWRRRDKGNHVLLENLRDHKWVLEMVRLSYANREKIDVDAVWEKVKERTKDLVNWSEHGL